MTDFPRFYDPEAIFKIATQNQLNNAESHHATKVLRLRIGKIICVFNNKNQEVLAEIDTIEKNFLTYTILKELKNKTEPDIDLTLFFPLTKSDKFEWVLQKATELGVARIAPYTCERSITNFPNAKKQIKKMERWNSIILSAVKQCGRRFIPELLPVFEFKNIIENNEKYTAKIICYENEEKQNLTDLLKNKNILQLKSAGIIIGPEGGFTEEEIEQSKNKNWECVSLGNRILRCETAAITSLSILMATAGEI